MTFTIEPIVPKPEQSGVDFGAMIHDLDLDKLTGKSTTGLCVMIKIINTLYNDR